MLYKTVEDLSDRAWLLYQAAQPLRVVDRQQEEVRYSTHRISIPRSMQSRATKIYSHLGDEKLTRAAALLNPVDGLTITVARAGETQKAGSEREITQEWLQGGITSIDESGPRRPSAMVTQDILLYGRAWMKVLPLMEAWDGMPGEHADDQISIAVDDYDPTDDAALKRAAVQAAESITKAQYRHKCRRFPITAQWVPATGVHDFWDTWGLRQVWELQEMSAIDVLMSFLDEAGKPYATRLADAVDSQKLDPTSTVTVCTFADREHLQVAIVGLLMDEGDEAAPNRTQVAEVAEIIYEDAHGMTEVPYAYFDGRDTQSRNPQRRFNGFLKPVRELIIAYDQLLTQLLSSVRMVAWPSLVLFKSPDAQGSGDRPAKVTLVEGDVYAGLAPGDEIRNPQWTNPSDYRLMFEALQELSKRIDTATLSAASYGQANTSSGYELAQLDAGSQTVLEPFTQGLERGWKRVSRLMLLAGSALMAEGSGDIPVRVVDTDAIKYVTLTEDLASQDWEINVSVRSRPAGGEMALAQTVAFLEDRGWIDRAEAQERMGIRNPQRMLEGRLQDQVLMSPKTLDLITSATNDRALASLQQALAPKQPDNPLMPMAAVGALQTQGALGRLPAGFDPSQMPGMGPTGLGLPSPAAGNMAPNPPSLSDHQITQHALGGPGGQVYGQASSLPGGLARQSSLLSRSAA